MNARKNRVHKGDTQIPQAFFFMALEDLVHFWVIYKTTVNKNAMVMVLHSHKLQSVEPFQSRGWKNMFTITRFR